MMRTIDPPDFSLPGISQGMLVPAGNLLFLSGHVALGPSGIVGDTIEAQLEQIFKNLTVTLTEAGTDFNNVARLTIYVKDYDPDMLPSIREVRNKYINVESPPASTLIGVANLAFPELLIEVEAVARVP